MPLNVTENIRIRSAELGEGRSSTLKTALIVPGGVLQSICNCAALAALSSLGITNFDTVFAVSAGAVNAAYGLANQAPLGIAIYLEDVNRLRFINPFRLGNIMDLDYLFHDVIQGTRRLDLPTLLASPSKLRMLSTDITNRQARWFAAANGDVLNMLRAACSAEVLSRRPVSIGQSSYGDGYLFEPLPLLSALKEPYTDILVLLNKPLRQRDVPFPTWLQKGIINPWIRKHYHPSLVENSENSWKVYNQALEIIWKGTYEKSDGDAVRIAAIPPDKEVAIGMFERNPKRLFRAAFSSWKNTLSAYQQETSTAMFLKVLVEAGLKSITLRQLQSA